jgi:hypothetical protein
MPICLALENACCLNNLGVIQRASHKLDAHRQAMLAKAARHSDRG